MKNRFFYIPFCYFLKTRISSKSKFLSWILIYFVPVFTVYYFLYSGSQIHHLIFSFLLGVTIIYNNYEIGYIQNDCETIKKEVNPTVRLNSEEIESYEKNKFKIYRIRLFVFFVLLIILWFFQLSTIGYFLFSTSAILILLIYSIYNAIRSRLNLVLHFILVAIRYFGILLLLHPNFSSSIFFVIQLLLLFPIPNLLERSGSKRFNFKLFQKAVSSEYNLSIFRALYYLIIFAIFYFFSVEKIFLCLSGYFLIYRSCITFLLTYLKYFKK